MAPKRKQKSKSKGTTVTSTISTKPADKEEQAKARALKRAERVEARLAEAEKRKEAGNAHFRAGEYNEAIKEYESAIGIHGPSAPYLSNLAAAWLKLEEYDNAELCAQRALALDPKFIKARYRRGLARKGNLEFGRAVVDFYTILSQDPSSTEAQNALRETLTLMCIRVDDDDVVASDDEGPLLGDTGIELESVSDSSDWNHGGNSIPCRFYNHDGCERGNACKFSHAPDHKSVRDRLGRNVCIYFLLGNCLFGSSACVYAHDKTYLPTGRWWEEDNKRLAIQHILDSLRPDERPASMPYILGLIDNRIAWAAAHGTEMGHVVVPSRAEQTFRDLIDIGPTMACINPGRGGSSRGGRGGRHERAGGSGRNIGRGGRGQILQFNNEDEWESCIEERMNVNNYGFTEDEEMELLSQGVKPWDDDAWAVRDLLYSL